MISLECFGSHFGWILAGKRLQVVKNRFYGLINYFSMLLRLIMARPECNLSRTGMSEIGDFPLDKSTLSRNHRFGTGKDFFERVELEYKVAETDVFISSFCRFYVNRKFVLRHFPLFLKNYALLYT